jgi:hypothetical protein
LSTSSRPRSTKPCAVKAKVTELGGSIPPKSERTPAKFNRFVKAEIARWSPILKAASAETGTAGQSGAAGQPAPAPPGQPSGTTVSEDYECAVQCHELRGAMQSLVEREARSRSMKTTLVIACPADTAFAKLVPASPKIGRMIATNVGI